MEYISDNIVHEVNMEKYGGLARWYENIFNIDAQGIPSRWYFYLLKIWQWSILILLMRIVFDESMRGHGKFEYLMSVMECID